MTEKTFEALTDEEWQMIETIRENRDKDGFSLLIERQAGACAIELKVENLPFPERGTGADFSQAWSNLTGLIS